MKNNMKNEISEATARERVNEKERVSNYKSLGEGRDTVTESVTK